MDSDTTLDLVRGALRDGALSFREAVVRNGSGAELALSERSRGSLRDLLSRSGPPGLGFEQAALLQLVAFYLLDRGRLAPVVDYGAFLEDGPRFVQPSEVSLEITKLCNLRCVHCYNDSGLRDAAELSDEEKLALADHLVRWGVRRLTLTGGEPTLDPTFPSLISLARDNGVKLKVTTNGWSFSEEFLAAIDDGTVAHVALSLDGADEPTHDTFRGRHGSYARVLEAMRVLGEHRPGALQLNVSIHEASLRQMEAIAELAAAHRFDAVSFKPVVSSGRRDGRTDFILSPADLEVFRAERARVGARYARRLIVEGNVLGGGAVPEAALDRIGCKAADRSMLILSNGLMTPCDALNASSWAPDVRKTSPMRAWMTHPLFTGFRSTKAAIGAQPGCPGIRFARSSGGRSPALRVLQ